MTDQKPCEVCGRDYTAEQMYKVQVGSPDNPPLHVMCCKQCWERNRARGFEIVEELKEQGYVDPTHMMGVELKRRLREWHEQEGYYR